MASSDDDGSRSIVLNTNARASFFLSHTLILILVRLLLLLLLLRLFILFLFLFLVVVVLLLLLVLVPLRFFLLLIIPYGGHTQVRDERRRSRRRAGRMRERTRVKDDCMSNLRHGDYNYVTFALVLFSSLPPFFPRATII